MSDHWLVPALASGLLTMVGLYLVERRAAFRAVLQERRHHEKIVATIKETYERDVVRLTEVYERLVATTGETARMQMEAVVRLTTTGQAQTVAAVVEEREPDAVAILQRATTAQTIDRGMDELRKSYRALGVEVADSDLREEVEAILAGVLPVYPAEPTGRPTPEVSA